MYGYMYARQRGRRQPHDVAPLLRGDQETRHLKLVRLIVDGLGVYHQRDPEARVLLDAEQLVEAAGLAAGVGRADPGGKGAARRAEGFDEPAGRSTISNPSADESCVSSLEAAVFGEYVALPCVDL